MPEACSPLCGGLTSEVIAHSVGGKFTNIVQDPWHVGIYMIEGSSYSLRCGGTIANARIVLSAMHCFWNREAGKPCT